MSADPVALADLVLGPAWRIRAQVGAPLFDAQLRPLLSQAKRKAVRCSRRAGKTVLAAAGLASALEAAPFDVAVVYAARTRAVAKNLIWGKLKELQRTHGFAWKFNEADLRVENARGGFLLVVGLDKPAEINKLRGLKMLLFVGDEPATYSALLGDLLVDVVEPATGDLRGEIWLIGTPGPVCAGFWHDASNGVLSAWEPFHWTIRDNPHFPDPEGWIAHVLAEKGWQQDSPAFRREYLGEWARDDAAQVYRYVPRVNDAPLPAHYDVATWHHTLGVDFGVNDDCAWVVLASAPHERTVYVLEACSRGDLLVDDAVEVTAALAARYRVDRIVGDSGGLGKPYVEAWNRRHAGRQLGTYELQPMAAADKLGKRAHVDVLNTELRTGRLLVCPPARLLGVEWESLPWADEARLKEHPAYDNHMADAALYAFMNHYAYLEQPKQPRVAARPAVDSDDADRDDEDRSIRQRGKAWWDA